MSFDLPSIAKRTNGRRATAIVFRAIYPTAAQQADLAAIYIAVIRHWRDVVQRHVMPALAHERLADMLVDSAGDIGASIDAGDDGFFRLLVTLTPSLRDWAVRLEAWHRGAFSAASVSATNIKLDTLLGPEGAARTLDAFLTENVSLIRNVSDQVRQRVATIALDAFQNRTPRREVAKLMNEATGLGRARSLRIAADQTTKLSALLDRDRQLEIGIDQFLWRHSGKVHYRPRHKARNGKVFPWLSNSLRGDLPGVAINCGCKAQAYIGEE